MDEEWLNNAYKDEVTALLRALERENALDRAGVMQALKLKWTTSYEVLKCLKQAGKLKSWSDPQYRKRGHPGILWGLPDACEDVSYMQPIINVILKELSMNTRLRLDSLLKRVGNHGFTKYQIEHSLRYLVNRKIIKRSSRYYMKNGA